MEAFGIVATSRPIRIPFLSGAAGPGFDSQSHLINLSLADLSAAGGVAGQRPRFERLSRKTRKVATRIPNLVFSDQAQLDYYSTGGSRKIRCGSACEKKEKVNATKNMRKKKLKMLKGLSTDLAMFSEIGFGLDPDTEQLKIKMIAEAAKLLQEQLQQLRAEEKDLKQTRKEEKGRSKVAQMSSMLECEMSSSSSSESSDSECEEVLDMNLLHTNSSLQQISPALPPVIEHEKLELHSIFSGGRTASDFLAPVIEVESVLQSTETQEENSNTGKFFEASKSESPEQDYCVGIGNNFLDNGKAKICSGTSVALAGVSPKKIEVCMGGKCRKSGSAMLLEEFQRVVGVESAVSGCKCMGKCRDGPNVRISNCFDDLQADLVHDIDDKTTVNPFCIGVSLDDVGVIVANFLGESQDKFGVATAS